MPLWRAGGAAADGAIVALAARYACPLITSDSLIAAYYPLAVW